jgi:hypothetical protein
MQSVRGDEHFAPAPYRPLNGQSLEQFLASADSES